MDKKFSSNCFLYPKSFGISIFDKSGLSLCDVAYLDLRSAGASFTWREMWPRGRVYLSGLMASRICFFIGCIRWTFRGELDFLIFYFSSRYSASFIKLWLRVSLIFAFIVSIVSTSIVLYLEDDFFATKTSSLLYTLPSVRYRFTLKDFLRFFVTLGCWS